MFGVLLADKLSDQPYQVTDGKTTSTWQRLLQSSFMDVELDGNKIVSGWKNSLALRGVSGQKDKNSLHHDLLMVIRGDKALFKPVVDASKGQAETLKKRSVALYICKQLFSAQSSMRFLKR